MKEFYEHFISSDRIELKNDVAAEHGLPTDDAAAGGPCEELNPPFYVNNCHYSGARHILNKVCRYVYNGQLWILYCSYWSWKRTLAKFEDSQS